MVFVNYQSGKIAGIGPIEGGGLPSGTGEGPRASMMGGDDTEKRVAAISRHPLITSRHGPGYCAWPVGRFTGTSLDSPHMVLVDFPALDCRMYHVAVEGRNTAMSVFSSPS